GVGASGGAVGLAPPRNPVGAASAASFWECGERRDKSSRLKPLPRIPEQATDSLPRVRTSCCRALRHRTFRKSNSWDTDMGLTIGDSALRSYAPQLPTSLLPTSVRPSAA